MRVLLHEAHRLVQDGKSCRVQGSALLGLGKAQQGLGQSPISREQVKEKSSPRRKPSIEPSSVHDDSLSSREARTCLPSQAR